jgi:hypothetical protein
MVDFLFILFIVFGTSSFFCILIWVIYRPDRYFSAVMASPRPQILGPYAAETDTIMSYYVTRIFLVCACGLILFYLYFALKA